MERWSWKHDACIGHGGTDVPHHAGGLCNNCYQRQHSKKYRRVVYTWEQVQAEVGIATDEARVEAFAWIDSILVGGSCRYRGGVVTLEIGDQSFQKEFD